MSLSAVLDFGTEPISVGNVSVTMDVTELAEKFWEVLEQVPADTLAVKEIALTHPLINGVLKSVGLPEIEKQAAAFKFAQDVIGRALELKNEACGAWATKDEPALPQDTPDFE